MGRFPISHLHRRFRDDCPKTALENQISVTSAFSCENPNAVFPWQGTGMRPHGFHFLRVIRAHPWSSPSIRISWPKVERHASSVSLGKEPTYVSAATKTKSP